MIDYLVLGGFIAFFATTAFVAGRYLTLLDHREERELRRYDADEARKSQRTADVVAIAQKADDVEAALLKHEERICALELTAAGAPVRRRP